MKVIITGATGVVGGGALQVALKHPEVTSVVVLVRRETGVSDPKLKTIIKKDYTRYEPEDWEHLRGADGCIWCVLPTQYSYAATDVLIRYRALGSPTDGMEVHQRYPRVALEAFSTHLAAHTSSGKPFRFVLTSGAAVISNQSIWLPPGLSMLQERGKMELEFLEFAAKNQGRWQSFVARPAMVLKPGASSWLPAMAKIPVEVLGAAMVDAIANGWEEQTKGNGALKARGEAAVKLMK